MSTRWPSERAGAGPIGFVATRVGSTIRREDLSRSARFGRFINVAVELLLWCCVPFKSLWGHQFSLTVRFASTSRLRVACTTEHQRDRVGLPVTRACGTKALDVRALHRVLLRWSNVRTCRRREALPEPAPIRSGRPRVAFLPRSEPRRVLETSCAASGSSRLLGTERTPR